VKRATSPAGVLILPLLLLLGVPLPASPAVRLIEVPNASFEDGDKTPDRWNFGAPDRFQLAADSMHGKKSLHITASDGDWIDGSLDLPTLPPGEKISAACWLKAKDIKKSGEDWKSFGLWLVMKQSDGQEVKVELFPQEGTHGWKWLTKTDIQVPDDNISAKLTLQFHNIQGEVWYDRIVLVRGSDLPPETISSAQAVANQVEILRAALAKTRNAVRKETVEEIPVEVVADSRSKIQSIILLAEELEKEAQGLAKKFEGKSYAALKAGEATMAATNAKNKVLEAIKTIAEAEKMQAGRTSAAAVEEASAAKVDAALKALEEAQARLEAVETAAAEPLIMAGTWGGGVMRLDKVWEDDQEKLKWSLANTTALPQAYVEFLAADPAGFLYYGGQGNLLYKSENNGKTWSLTPTALPADANAYAIDPTVPERRLMTGWGGGAWWTDNEGRSWTRGKSPSAFLRAGRTARKDGKTGYYAIADGTTLIRTGEFRGDWETVASMPVGIKAWDSADKPGAAGTCLLATDAGLAEVTPPGGVAFIRTDVSCADARSLLVVDDRVLIGTAGGGVIEWHAAKGNEPATARRLDYNLGNPHVPAIVLSMNPRPAKVGEGEGSVVPRFWTARSNGLINSTVNCVAVKPGDEKTLYCTTQGGFHRSEDKGATWVASNEGMVTLKLGRITVDPGNGDILYVVPSYVGEQGGVRKSTDGGKTWVDKSKGLISTDAMWIAMKPAESWIMYIATYGGGTAISSNGGDSWSENNKGLYSKQIFCVIPGFAWSGYLFTGTESAGAFKWDDKNGQWVEANSQLTSKFVTHLAEDPNNWNTWLLASGDGGLFKSDDGGGTWRPVNQGITTSAISKVVYHPKKKGVVYAGCRSYTPGRSGAGVFRSTDGGETWTADNAGLLSLDINDITISPAGVVYVGTKAGIFYKLD
jgi:photosystem II stability/assembly factor-like uncharacterized protein